MIKFKHVIMKKVINNVLNLIFSFLGLTVIIFIISHLIPGNPLYAVFGESATKISAIRKQAIYSNMGLDDSILLQYKKWVKSILFGDLGVSFKYNIKVSSILKDGFINTILLTSIILILIIIFSLVLGFICAYFQGTRLDRILTNLGTIFYCIPSFWLGLIMILIFSVNFKILPSSGVYDIGYEGDMINRIKHMILPCSVVFIGHIGYFSNFVRDRVIEELSQDYLILAKSKGVSKVKILFSHVLRNILPSILSLIFISVNHIISGSLIIEVVFTYPGLGKYIFESAKFHDYPLLMGGIVITGTIVIIANTFSDIITYALDPRIIKE